MGAMMVLAGFMTFGLEGSVRPIDSSILAVGWLFAAILLLDTLDISLPRGDSMGVAGAICSSALVVLEPSTAGILVVLSAVASHLIRRRRDAVARLGLILLSRGAAFFAAASILWLLARWGMTSAEYIIVPAVFVLVEFVGGQLLSAVLARRPFLRLLRGNAPSQAPLVAAQWSAAALLLLTYRGMSIWSLLPAVALLLLMRQSYALFLDIRETYRTTIEVLVEAAESQDRRRVGHAERTARIARAIAMKVGLSVMEVEQVGYAALLHDLGELAGQSSPDERAPERYTQSASILHDVEFFKRVEPILRVCDGDGEHVTSERSVLGALIVALSSDIDAMDHPAVGAAHANSALDPVLPRVSPVLKARIVGAALGLGYRVPAVG
jgi:HD domain